MLRSRATARVAAGSSSIAAFDAAYAKSTVRGAIDGRILSSRVELVLLMSAFARAFRSHTSAAVPILVQACGDLPQRPRA